MLRGFNPNEPHQLSQAYPVADGVSVLSGQVISLEADDTYEGGHKWVKGWTAGIPYIAINDWVPSVGLGSDADVMEAGKLVGLSSAGQFEIQTPFWAKSDGTLQDAGSRGDFVVDAPVGPVATGATGAGSIKVTTVGSNVPIMGYVTRHRGAQYLGPTAEAGKSAGNNGHNSNAVAANLWVVTFQTAYSPNPA